MAGYKYNLTTNQYPEYSNVPNADSTFGLRGTNTPAAKTNQQTPPKPAGDAWALFGQAAAQWRKRTVADPTAPPPPSTPQTTPNVTYTPASLTGVIQGKLRDPDGNPVTPAPVSPPAPGPVVPPPVTPPKGTPTDPNADPTTPATVPGLTGTAPPPPVTGTGGTIAGNVPPPNTPRGPNGTLTNGNDNVPMIPGTEGWEPAARQKLNEYITKGWGFLAQHPDWYAQYLADLTRLGMTADSAWAHGVDMADYLAAQHPDIDWSHVPDNAKPGRAGYDTWRFTDAAGTPRGFAPQSGPTTVAGNSRGGPAASPWIGDTPGAPTSGSPYGADRSIQGVQDAAWQAAEDARQKAAADALAHPPQTPPAGSPGPQTPPPSGAPAAPPPTPPPTNPNPNASAPPPSSPFGPGVPGGSADYVSRLLDPLHHQQQQELLRVLRQQGANDGTMNSGAFGDIVGKAEGSLIAQQGAQKATFITDAENRALQKYGIDTNKVVAEMQDATTRFGIQTNADLERWLNSADSNTLNKYGIDKNDLLARYKADLDASGQKYSADQQVNAARISAAAAHAAAAAAASAALREAELRYNLGLQQLNQSGSQFDKQNLLDWANLQAGLYNNDSNRQLGWATLASQLGMTPAQLAALLQGYQPPAPVYNAP